MRHFSLDSGKVTVCNVTGEVIVLIATVRALRVIIVKLMVTNPVMTSLTCTITVKL